MAISATAGNVTSARFGFRPGSASISAGWNYNYLTFGGVTYRQPRVYREDPNDPGYIVDAEIYLMDDTLDGGNQGAARRVNLDFNKGDALVTFSEPTVGQGYVHTWVENETETDGQPMGQGATPWGDSYTNVRNMGCELEAGIKANTVFDQVEIRTVFVDFENTDETNFTGGDNSFEITGIHPESSGSYDWSPMDANESCSAFVAKALACENMNTAVKKTRPAWSIPLYDDNSTALT
jgi:hypothetical protein